MQKNYKDKKITQGAAMHLLPVVAIQFGDDRADNE